MIRSRLLLLAGALAAASPDVAARAQQREGHGGHEGPPDEPRAMADAAMADAAMAGPMVENPHLVLTPTGPATAEERRRAAELAATIRRSIERYRDVKVAEADGYRMFAPNVKAQPVYHYTSGWRSVKSAFRFDPAEPPSLLYRRDAGGALVLVGAMYTAPKGASLEELDARVPLSVARWHRHVDICVPPRSRRERWAETRGGVPLFGPAGSVATREACDREDGHWLPSVFGWMVHANVFAGDEGAIWGHGHQH
jgi:hypothetical protein